MLRARAYLIFFLLWPASRSTVFRLRFPSYTLALSTQFLAKHVVSCRASAACETYGSGCGILESVQVLVSDVCVFCLHSLPVVPGQVNRLYLCESLIESCQP